jgi:hypothetical protein
MNGHRQVASVALPKHFTNRPSHTHRPRHGDLLHVARRPGRVPSPGGPRRGLAGKGGEDFAEAAGWHYAKGVMEVAVAEGTTWSCVERLRRGVVGPSSLIPRRGSSQNGAD